MGLGCLLSPAGCLVDSAAHATLGDLFGALTNWVVDSVQWMLGAAGSVLATTSDPTTVTTSAAPLYHTMETIAPALMLLGLVVATLGALRHGDAGALARVYLGVAPASVGAIVLAPRVATLVLSAVNQLSTTASASVTSQSRTLAARLGDLVGTVPGFGVFLLAVALVIGSWLVWCELVVRVVVLSLLLVLTPVAAALATFPALRRVVWRLAETFVAVAVSKFLIVVALVLGLDEVTGTSATRVVGGAVTLGLAAGAPFLLLRLVPFVEQSALHHVEGVRQRAGAAARTSAARAARVANLAPDAPMVAPERPDDLGLPLLEGDGELDFPEASGDPPAPPVGERRVRHGHVAWTKDRLGPVVTWHWDD